MLMSLLCEQLSMIIVYTKMSVKLCECVHSFVFIIMVNVCHFLVVFFLYLVAYFSFYHEKAINALYELA